MTLAQTDEPTPHMPLRLWPGVVAAVLLLLVRFVVPLVVPDARYFGVIGGFVCVLAIVVWWVFFSRAPWSERLGAIVLLIVAPVATSRVIHVSIAKGMMGMMFPIYAIPILSLALVAWAAASRRLSTGPRRAALVAAILLGCGVLTLVRTDGLNSAGSQFAWRWSKTPEERLLAQAGDEPAALPAIPAVLPAAPAAPPAAPAADAPVQPAAPAAAATGAAWPGFRGPHRDRHHPRRPDRDRLVGVAAGPAMAPADRTRLVVLRGPRRPPLHPGAAR